MCCLLIAQHSVPYSGTGITAVLYSLPLIVKGIVLSQITPVRCLHFIQPAVVQRIMSLPILRSLLMMDPVLELFNSGKRDIIYEELYCIAITFAIEYI